MADLPSRTMDPLALRQALTHVLEASPADEDRLLVEIEAHLGPARPVYSSLLGILTHLSFSEPEARRHWARVKAHRDRLREQLSRDVGLRVAILDYFVNVDRELKNPKVIELALYERTERSAVTDALTGLYNHGYFVQALGREMQRSRRHGLRTSLLLLDLDDFKKLNDTRGHLEGDRALARAASFVRMSVREIDVAARYGGEEFAVILPETPAPGGYVVADRIRRRIEDGFRRAKGVKTTVSGGLATFPDDAGSAEELVRLADEALYRSKRAGKNRISLVSDRRQHPRLPARHALTVETSDGASRARAGNVSEGGLMLTTRQPVAVGSTISFRATAATVASRGRGQVVRVLPHPKGYEVGVRLTEDEAEGGTKRSATVR